MKRINPRNIQLTPLGKKVFGGIGIALIAVILLIFITISNNKKNEFKTVNEPQKAKAVAQSLVEIVGKIYQLPNETPTIATITEKGELPPDPFYEKAIEGDKILIFADSRKIIMYRPSENKVIDVGTLEPKTEATPVPEVAGSSTSSTGSAQQTLSLPQPQTTPKILRKLE
ncbi:MAG: hypothetical protein Q7T74_01765 [Candidatus Saccharibacteria bacterium]|nr:hypothetical protein [Candidatus Saccharibacteria bacterium]